MIGQLSVRSITPLYDLSCDEHAYRNKLESLTLRGMKLETQARQSERHHSRLFIMKSYQAKLTTINCRSLFSSMTTMLALSSCPGTRSM